MASALEQGTMESEKQILQERNKEQRRSVKETRSQDKEERQRFHQGLPVSTNTTASTKTMPLPMLKREDRHPYHQAEKKQAQP
jgi:hypothetical protein